MGSLFGDIATDYLNYTIACEPCITRIRLLLPEKSGGCTVTLSASISIIYCLAGAISPPYPPFLRCPHLLYPAHDSF